MRESINRLIERHLVERFDRRHYRLTDLGLKFCTENAVIILERMSRATDLADFQSTLEALFSLQQEVRSGQLNPTPNGSVPASDRLVRIDDNSKAKSIQDDLADLKDAVRKNNEANLTLEDRERIISELEAGEVLLKSRQIRVRALSSVLIPALKWIALAFAGGLVGQLATDLLRVLLTILGL